MEQEQTSHQSNKNALKIEIWSHEIYPKKKYSNHEGEKTDTNPGTEMFQQ